MARKSLNICEFMKLFNILTFSENSEMNKKIPLEVLQISIESSDPYSTLLVEPSTGTTYYSLKGSELQGGVSGVVEPLGKNGDKLIINIVGKPLLYCISLRSKGTSTSSVRSVLPASVKSLAVHSSGNFIFAACGSKIYTWMVTNGELLSITEDNFQNITVLKLSKCDTYLITGALDGIIKLYLTTDLMTRKNGDIDSVKAVLSISQHSLSVNDLHLTLGRNPRILSVSLDHTVNYYSVCAKQSLIKLSVETPITSCCMDQSETTFYLGGSNGKIYIVDISSQSAKQNNLISANGENNFENGIFIIEQHKSKIVKLCLNQDGTRLASGDENGTYCIFDVYNYQCLKTATMKAKITTLKFGQVWNGLINNSTEKELLPPPLQKQKSNQNTTISAFIENEFNESFKIPSRKVLIDLLAENDSENEEATNNTSIQNRKKKRPCASSNEDISQIQELKSEMAKVLKINKQLYKFAAEIVIPQ